MVTIDAALMTSTASEVCLGSDVITNAELGHAWPDINNRPAELMANGKGRHVG